MLLCLLAGALILFVAYAVYVFVGYYRLEDGQVLEIRGEAALEQAETGRSYRAVSYNIGFGAYGPDFTFFMDGGTESRGRSPQEVADHVSGALTAAEAAEGELYFFQ